MNIINTIAEKIFIKKNILNDFFNHQFNQNPALFYNSIDLRHSGYKISAIDTNCYPAGFNNLSNSDRKNAKNLVEDFFSQQAIAQKNSLNNIFIIPENHTRNMRYLENLSAIFEILQHQNRQIYIATFNPEINKITLLELENGKSITLFPLQKISNKLALIDDSQNTIFADLAILNNDLTNGIPEILNNIITPLHPNKEMGWYQRTKSNHFTIYNQIAEEIAKILELDPWLISSLHENCDDINFKENIGLDCLAKNVDKILKNIAEKYHQHNIKDTPYCYIKADNGTYGMAVWTVNKAEDVLEINKKERNKMNMLKGATQTTKVMLQEGIITQDKINNAPAEPMIYMIKGDVAGYLFRCNQERDSQISLNASGAQFFNLDNLPQNNNFLQNNNLKDKQKDLIQTFELIAKIASLASAIESKKLNIL